MKNQVLFLFFMILCISAYAQSTINVPGDQQTIQDGIDVASDGDIVLVQPGTYIENINFHGKNITVSSLILTTGDESYIDNTVIDGNQNGSVVKFVGGEDSSASINGFTIMNGSGQTKYGKQTHGGGIFLDYGSSPKLLNLKVRDNIASNCNGAGICCWGNNDCLIENVIVMNNDGRGDENEYTNDGSAGILLANSSPVLRNVTITDNTGIVAGGFFCSGNSNPVLINVTIANNMAYPRENNKQTAEFFCWNNTKPVLVNTIIWGDSLPSVVISADSLTVSHSNIRDGIVFNGPGVVNWLYGNINHDPLFMDHENQDYRLSLGSPCIDEGIQDVMLVYNNGNDSVYIPPMNYNGYAPDMGAYEYEAAGGSPDLITNDITSLLVYPNPAHQELNISAEGSTIDEVSFYSITGQRILRVGPVHGSIDISQLQAGMYIVEVSIENLKLRRKLVIE